MNYDLGIDLGTTFTAAAVARNGQVRITELGNRAAVIPSVILVREDEEVLTGEAAERRAISEPERVAREFKRRLGDPTPLLLGGRPYSAEQLQSRVLRWVLAHVTEREGGPPARIAITRPANWGPYKLEVYEQALRLAGVDASLVLTEPEAAAIHYASQERLDPGALVAVYDLGGGTFDAAVLRKTDDGFELLGRPEGIERLGGVDFDEAVFDHVARALGGALAELDPDDRAVATAVARLRQECVEAKESLSADTEVTIPVALPQLQTDVRITRAEFEALIRSPLADSIDALHRALRSADVTPDELTAVLLVGASSRIPLVAQLVTAELGRPVAVDAHPKHGVAMGAALALAALPHRNLADGVSPSVAAVAVPSVAASTTSEDAADQTAQRPASTPVPEPADRADTLRRDTPSPELAEARTEPIDPPTLRESGSGHASFEAAGGGRGSSRILSIAAAAVAVVVIGGVVFAMNRGAEDLDAIDEPIVAVEDQDEDDENESNGDAGPPPEQDTDTQPPDPEPAGGGDADVAVEARVPNVPIDIPYVTLDDIRIEAGRYIVTYTPNRFDPLIDADPTTRHIHFFWDIWDPATVGTQEPQSTRGSWLVYDTDPDGDFLLSHDTFTVASRPADATALCGIVSDHLHQVVTPQDADELVSCLDLPDL